MGRAGTFILTISLGLILALTTGVAAGGSAAGPGNAPNPSGAVRQPRTAHPGEVSAREGGVGSSKGPQKPRPSASAAKEHKLKTMVVTATRIEQPLATIGTTVTVIDSGQIETQKIRTVDTVLRQVPGVQINQSGSPGTVSSVFIRGATSAQTLVLMDGVEVNTGAGGAFDLARLTTDNLDRIEVIRGAGGSLYGSQAIGGVINLITPEGEGAPRFTLLSEGGNRATQRQVMTVGGSAGRLGYSGAISYFSTTGFRPINDSSDDLSGNVRLDFHLDRDTAIRGFARYVRGNTSLVNFSNFLGVLDPNAHQRNEFMLFKGEIEHRFSRRLLARASAFFVRSELRDNALPFPANQRTQIDRVPDEIRGGNLEVIIRPRAGFRTLAGFDFKDRWARSLSGFSSAFFSSTTLFRARRQEYAGYVQQQASLLDGHVLATGGVRVDGNSEFGIEVSPSWAVAIPVERIATTFRGSYSEGFRAPSFNELFFPNFGNPNLRPEISSEYDGGFTTRFGEIASFTATYFSRRIHSLVVAVPAPGTLFGVMAGNAGRVDVQGIELVPSVTPLQGLRLSGNFTLIDETHVSSSANIRPLRVPKRSASALLTYIRDSLWNRRDRIALSLSYTFVGDRDDITPAGGIRSHVGYHRFDLTASYAGGVTRGLLRNEEVFVRVSNLFDRNYSEAFGFKAPPINFVAGVRIDL